MHSDLRRGVSGTLSGPAASQYSPGGSGGGAAYMAAYAQVEAQILKTLFARLILLVFIHKR
jgi:Asp-tRNA(Asn)/Glu-tRNA(Gln) amidotransferase A subunit family amidase